MYWCDIKRQQWKSVVFKILTYTSLHCFNGNKSTDIDEKEQNIAKIKEPKSQPVDNIRVILGH